MVPKAWGAYARDTVSISPFEAGWQILQPCTCGFRKTDIPAKSDYDLYPCPKAWTGMYWQSYGWALRQSKKVLMPIRISCRDKSLNRVQLVEYTGINTFLTSDPKASYTDRKTKLRILCGSV
jgi:hypothetical protein